jgi:maltose-binding protein MalE
MIKKAAMVVLISLVCVLISGPGVMVVQGATGWLSFDLGDIPEISFEVHADMAGYHNLTVNYAAVPGGRDILADVRVNGHVVYHALQFHRFFMDSSDAWRTQTGNQNIPSQVEVVRYTDFTLGPDPARPLAIWLEAGNNEVVLVLNEGYITVDGGMVAAPVHGLLTYAQYSAQHSHVSRAAGPMIAIQAQHALYKTSATLFPVNERTDSLLYPYHPFHIKLNAIGGFTWRTPGQRLEWEVEVPVSGMYRIALRYAQREVRGFTSRILTINGQVPFAEAADLRFNFATGFNSRYLASNETGEYFWFYLPAGTHLIGLEASLGVFDDIVYEATRVLNDLTAFYQDVVMVTSTRPDPHRDYQITIAIPGFRDRLHAIEADLTMILEKVDAAGDTFSEANMSVERMRDRVARLADRPDRVGTYLIEFQHALGAMANFITIAYEQPLLLDVIGVGGTEAELFRARPNFFQRMWHMFRAFIGSFIMDLSISMDVPEGVEQTSVEVWVSTGFDVFNVLGRVINEMFVPEHPHISVDLRLVDAGIIFPASLTGQGPDVILQANASMPTNFAFREAALDLTAFPDFDEVASWFHPAAIETLAFDQAVYALPDTMHFNVMFYRTDVFETVGIEHVPNTMNEFLATIPTLQARNMDIFFTTEGQPQPGVVGGMVGGITRGLNTVHVGILHQMGGDVFAPLGAYTNMANDIGLAAFRYWTDLYTKHNFVVETNVLTRFRMGDLPIVVADLSTLNVLNAAAPDIRGNWAIAPVPGMYRADGEFRRDNVLSVSCNFIVQNMVDQRGNKDEAWEFLSWFSSADAQTRFAQEIEAVLGHNWRYMTANLEAFESLGWSRHEQAVLTEMLDWAIAIPQVPGGYIAGREIHNAFINVVVDNGNPVDRLFIARDRINQELTAKRIEFGLE